MPKRQYEYTDITREKISNLIKKIKDGGKAVTIQDIFQTHECNPDVTCIPYREKGYSKDMITILNPNATARMKQSHDGNETIKSDKENRVVELLNHLAFSESLSFSLDEEMFSITRMSPTKTVDGLIIALTKYTISIMAEKRRKSSPDNTEEVTDYEIDHCFDSATLHEVIIVYGYKDEFPIGDDKRRKIAKHAKNLICKEKNKTEEEFYREHEKKKLYYSEREFVIYTGAELDILVKSIRHFKDSGSSAT